MKIRCIPSGSLGANTYIAWDEESKKGFIVDPGGYDSYTEDMIKKEGIQIEYIILTHGHGDHIGGVNAYMTAFDGAKLVACTHEKELLEDESLNLSRECTGQRINLEADMWVDDGDTVKVGNIELKFIHTPGHTKGGMCIYSEGILFSGDTLFQYSIGRTDFPGGSFMEIKQSIQEKLFKLPDNTLVLPGHMDTTTIAEEKKNNPFVCIR